MRVFTRHINPITRKRWQRFRHRRRAYVSLWLLGVIVVVSLSADLLSNSKPLWIRFANRHYWPLLRYYPESTFLADGSDRRPDYKALREHAVFRDNPDNRMLFAPVPYGPRETVSEARLQVLSEIEVRFQPVPRAGSLDVSPELSVVRTHGLEWLFGREPDLEGRSLHDLWGVPEAFTTAIAARFDNRARPREEVETAPRRAPAQQVRLSLATFRVRPQAPDTVRVTVREVEAVDAVPLRVRFDRAGEVAGTAPRVWRQMAETDREWIAAQAERCRTESVDPAIMTLAGDQYRVSFLNNVSWPYPPIRGHWMGIDDAGRDVLARVLHGLRIALLFGFLLVIASMFTGTIIGALQGYFGGRLDITAQRLIEIWSAIPFLYVMILVGSVFGTGFGILLFCYALFNWIGISYYMRAEFLRLRRQPFVEAARLTGVSTPAVIFRHILPNALTPVITFLPFSLVGAIGALTALDFLGFGLPPLAPSLGELLRQAHTTRWAWWLVTYPSVVLFVVMLLTAFVGEGIREAYDPRRPSKVE